MLPRLLLVLAVALFCGAASSPSAAPPLPDPATPLSRIVFGSCAHQSEPQPIWEPIVAARPELFLFLGDNIYADTIDMAVMRDKYAQLAAQPGYQKLRAVCPVLATWDDHDYGVNDGGADYPQRRASQQVFLDFFGEPQDSPRRRREGVYDARVFGPAGKHIQIILLDTRYHRSPIQRAQPVAGQTGKTRLQATGPAATVLGEAQWAWLEEQLKQPAEVRIIVSSIQVIAEDHPDEKWAVFPDERARLFRLIASTKASGVLFVSGDRHLAELSMTSTNAANYPLYDLTASALNRSAKKWRPYETNRHRVGTLNWGDNFGVIVIDWARPDPRIHLQVRDADGDIAIGRKVNLSTLQTEIP